VDVDTKTLCALVLVLSALLAAPAATASPTVADPCSAIDARIKKAYGFKPAGLTDEERERRLDELEDLWDEAKIEPRAWVPCLRAALSKPDADGYFLFDGSQLLHTLDDSPQTSQLALRASEKVDLKIVDLGAWVRQVVVLGYADLDTSTAAARWFDLKDPSFSLPEHFSLVGKSGGAYFLFGSMDERFATPALLKIASRDPRGENGALAVSLLMAQATAEATRGLGTLQKKLSPEVQKEVAALAAGAGRFTPRPQPKITRERFLAACSDLLRGDWNSFHAINREIPDAELDVVAILKPEDLPLLRKVRRFFVAHLDTDEHMTSLYSDFTKVIRTIAQSQ
jgi:hypothetical protein